MGSSKAPPRDKQGPNTSSFNAQDAHLNHDQHFSGPTISYDSPARPNMTKPSEILRDSHQKPNLSASGNNIPNTARLSNDSGIKKDVTPTKVSNDLGNAQIKSNDTLPPKPKTDSTTTPSKPKEDSKTQDVQSSQKDQNRDSVERVSALRDGPGGEESDVFIGNRLSKYQRGKNNQGSTGAYKDSLRSEQSSREYNQQDSISSNKASSPVKNSNPTTNNLPQTPGTIQKPIDSKPTADELKGRTGKYIGDSSQTSRK